MAYIITNKTPPMPSVTHVLWSLFFLIFLSFSKNWYQNQHNKIIFFKLRYILFYYKLNISFPPNLSNQVCLIFFFTILPFFRQILDTLIIFVMDLNVGLRSNVNSSSLSTILTVGFCQMRVFAYEANNPFLKLIFFFEIRFASFPNQ